VAGAIRFNYGPPSVSSLGFTSDRTSDFGRMCHSPRDRRFTTTKAATWFRGQDKPSHHPAPRGSGTVGPRECGHRRTGQRAHEAEQGWAHRDAEAAGGPRGWHWMRPASAGEESSPGLPRRSSPLSSLTPSRPGSVTALIDRLEAACCVRREADPADRRRVIVRPEPWPVATTPCPMPPICPVTCSRFPSWRNGPACRWRRPVR
jgi:hypothetical protein